MISHSGNNIFVFSILSLVFVVFAGCNSDRHKNSGIAIIQGNIQFPVNDKIYFYSYADSADIYLENKSAMDSSMVDKKGNYIFKLRCKNPLVFNLESGNKNLVTNLFISPGDDITINFSGKNNIPQVTPFSKAAEYNVYLIKFLDAFYLDPLVKQQYYIVSNYLDLNQFISYNEERKQSQLQFFKGFFREDSLKKEFKDYALNTIYYGIAVDKLVYLWKKRMKGEPVSADSSYFNFETPSFIENKDGFSCPAYVRFLNLYIKDIYERMVERGELPHDKKKILSPPVEKYKLALQLLNRPYRDAVLYHMMADDMNSVAEKYDSHRSSGLSLDSMRSAFKRKYSLE